MGGERPPAADANSLVRAAELVQHCKKPGHSGKNNAETLG
jgi:hypothetical protein